MTTSDRKVVTRFAPWPTGMLHIGGARTALFNWLYAKHTGGAFLLRIEDTGRERSKPEHVAAITNGLKWLELDWDGEPVSQYARRERHAEVARELLARGGAYRCYMTPEETDAARDKAREEKVRFESPWREADPATAPKDKPYAIRFKAPRDGDTVIEDRVQGRVVFPNKDLDDLIILRSDGTPTYNLSVVVDDHDMGITHVIRGDDHLTNAARQTQIYKALGWDTPIFAHVPLIHGPDGAKLSKRHGALGVDAYRAMGYLPAALRNYLVRLGWSHGDDEIMSTEDMVRWFDLDAIGRSAARFDFAKLENLNGHYLRETSDAEIMQRLKALVPELPNGGELSAKIGAEGWGKLERALPGLKERAKTLVELLDNADYLFVKRPLTLDAQAGKLLDEAGRKVLAALLPRLESVEPWTPEALDAAVRAYAEETGLKLGKVAQPLRAALTGKSTSPGIFDVLDVLGRDESLSRIRDHVVETKTA